MSHNEPSKYMGAVLLFERILERNVEFFLQLHSVQCFGRPLLLFVEKEH